MIFSADVTEVLNSQGYWASYNMPYFDDIHQLSGVPDTNITSHDYCPRANIFRRDQGNAISWEDMKHLMRYNDYLNDPLSMGLPNFAISGRFDLIPVVGPALGGTDAKITSADLFWQGDSWLYCGPPNEQVPAFSWDSRRWDDVSHVGVPITDDFEWVLI